MTTQHTPGPWTAHQESHGLFVSAASFCIAKLGDGNSPGQQENARLIAAAPELLAVLKRMVLDCERTVELECVHGSRVVDDAIAAIAKAEGV